MDSEIDDLLKLYPGAQRDSLIPILQDVQERFGYLSEEALIKVGSYLNLPVSKVYGLATFYNQFRFQPKGKYHIRVCRGTSCHVGHSMGVLSEFEKQLKVKSGETSRDGRFSLHGVSCMGGCGQGPVVQVNETYITKVEPSMVKEILENCTFNEE